MPTVCKLVAVCVFLMFISGRLCHAAFLGRQSFSSAIVSASKPPTDVLALWINRNQAKTRQTLDQCFHFRTKCPTRLFSTNSQKKEDWKVPKSIYIPEDRLDLSFVRSGGAGGQNVNKVNTQVQVKMHTPTLDWIPGEVRDRLKEQQFNRINKEGFLVLKVSEHRTQTANRKAAMDKLRDMILQAWPRPKERKLRKGLTKKAKERRREQKKKRSEIKASRRPVNF